MSRDVFFGFWFLLFGSVLIVFAMKYISAFYASRAQIAQDGAYRKLAADAVTAQSGNAATMSAIQSELAELRARMAAIEKILKEVE